MKTAIVILNWNGKELLERFLPTIIEHSADLASIYVADNASTDSSVGYVKEHFPSVHIIKNAVNGGYAKGYNDALKTIKADIYVLLNSDVQVTKGWLAPMIALFDDPRVSAAQPKIKDLKKPSHFEYAGAAGGFLDKLGYPYCRGRLFDTCEEDTGQYNTTIEVQWASGACLFVRASTFWEVGALDEIFFAHQEEIDLCWRIKNKGYRILACGDSEVYHLGGATLPSANPKKTFYNFRNTLFNVVKNIKGFKALFIILSRLLLDGIAALKFLLSGQPTHLLAILKAHLSFYVHIPALLQRRFHLVSSRRYADTTSIIWSYFVQKKHTYKDLSNKP